MSIHEKDECRPPRGLPEPLPEGERILWQGSPRWQSLARRVFHTRMILIYFGVLIGWRIISMAHDGFPIGEIALGATWIACVGAAAMLIVSVLSWLMARTTIYTITTRRVVLRFGVALPMTINVPFAVVKTAALKTDATGVGDIALSLSGKDRIAYLVLWPHARPWKMAPAEPSLRAIPDAAAVGEILGDALAQCHPMASATMPSLPKSSPEWDQTAPSNAAAPTLVAAAQ